MEKEVKDVQKYVRDVLAQQGIQFGMYKKYARVNAVQGVEGQQLATILKDGHAEVDLEHPEVVGVDGNGKPDWIVTNPGGEQYKVADSKFRKRYDVESGVGADGKYAPKGSAMLMMQIKEDIVIYVPWGENGALIPQHLRAGSWLNIDDAKDIYGIAEEEFKETYSQCDRHGVFYDDALRKAFEQGEYAKDDENAAE